MHRRRADRGSTLLGLLILVMVFAAVTLVALIDNTITASKVNAAQNLTARDLRAADNALESAVNDLRMDPDGEEGSTKACPGPTEYESNGRTVTVSATCTESARTMPADTGASAEAPSVKLVGADGYRAGNLYWTVFPETVRWKNDCARGDVWAGSCAPWSIGLGLPNFTAHGSELDGATPSLVHTSALSSTAGAANNRSLGFASDVVARNGSATMIDPAAAAPAVRVAGRYEQGGAGLFSAEGGGQCGIAGPSHPWNVIAARIVDVDDEAGNPTCGTDSTSASSLGDRLELGVRPAIPAADATVPACPSDPTGVAVLRPGRYDKADTVTLNQFFGGACPGRTFWFQPESTTQAGVYWFDVDNPTNVDGSAKARDLWSSLIISDPTVRVIFGTPTAGYTAAAAKSAVFPQACNPAAYGVEIILSPRTTIRHLDGKVAICDRDANTSTTSSPAALWQAGVADGGWRGLPDPAKSTQSISFRAGGWCLFGWCPTLAEGSGSFDGTESRWLATDGQLTNAHFTCTAFLGGACISETTFSAGGIGELGAEAPSPGPVTSLDLVVKGSAWQRDQVWAIYNSGRIGTEIRFFSPGATSATCGAFFPYAPDRMGATQQLVLSYDLLSSESETITGLPRCNNVDLDRSSLRGSRVDLKLSAVRKILAWNTVEFGYDVDGVELRAGWDLAATAAAGDAKWNDAANLLPAASGAVSDGSHGGVSGTCTTSNGTNCPTVDSTVTLTMGDNRDPYVPTSGTLQAAGVVITGNTSESTWFTGRGLYDLSGSPAVDEASTISVALSNLRGAAGTCTVSWSKVPFWGQGLYLDLLDPAIGTCNGVLTNAEQLVGSTMAVTVHMDRNDCGGWFEPDCPSYSVRIDSVKLSTVTSGGYTRPRAPMVATIGKASAAGSSSFNVFGQVSMPRNDLTIRWDGAAPVVNDGSERDGEAVPIGGGNMVLAGLGSFVGADGEAGVICCSPTKPAERIVHLEARIGSALAATADIRINDIGGPGSSLVIDDWSLKPSAG